MGIFQQFPYTNFHEFNLDQIIKIMREMQDEWDATKTEWASYKEFIDNYFETLDLDEETEKALRRLIHDGTLSTVIDPVIAAETAAWLAEHLTPTTPAIDNTLTVAGAGADAKVTGDKIKELTNDVNSINNALVAGGVVQLNPTDYVGLRLHPDTGVVTATNNARIAVFPVSKTDKLTLNLKYRTGTNINRCGIALTNKEVPEDGDTPHIVVLGNTVISADYTYNFSNSSGYRYCYVYYWTGLGYAGNVTNDVLLTEETLLAEYPETKAAYDMDCLMFSDFVKGNILADETHDAVANRISTDVIENHGGIRLVNVFESAGFEYNVRLWNSDRSDSTLLYNDWTTKRNQTITAPYFGILIRKSDNSNITDEERKNFYIFYDQIVRYNSYGRYYKNKFSILGDSLSTYGGNVSTSASDDPRYADGTWNYPGNVIRYPQNNLLTDVADMYWYLMMKQFDMTLGINESFAGSRCSWDGVTEDLTQGANKHGASMTRIGHLGDNGTPDLVLVNMGTNDQGGNVPLGTVDYTNPENYTLAQIQALPVATFADAYRTMLIRIMYLYPTAKIYCMTINYRKNTSLEDTDKYNEVIREVCDMLGVPLIDTRHSGISVFELGTYLGDTTHYNAKGMKLIADAVTKSMMFQV